jgi:hypothetical protein
MKMKWLTSAATGFSILFFITACSTSNLSVGTVRVKEAQKTINNFNEHQPVLTRDGDYPPVVPETKLLTKLTSTGEKENSKLNSGMFSKTVYRKSKNGNFKKAILLNEISGISSRRKAAYNYKSEGKDGTYSFLPGPSFIFGVIGFILVLIFVPFTPLLLILSILGLILFYFITLNNQSFEFFITFMISLALTLGVIFLYILFIAQTTNS